MHVSVLPSFDPSSLWPVWALTQHACCQQIADSKACYSKLVGIARGMVVFSWLGPQLVSCRLLHLYSCPAVDLWALLRALASCVLYA